jgi:hypothetical protein
MAETEKRPGGSGIIRHEAARTPRYGFSEHSTLEYIRQREAIYASLFGPPALVYDDALPGMLPHIDVYLHEPGFRGRPCYTLVTGGMSDRRMKLPADAPADLPARAELIFYLPAEHAPRREYIDFLRVTARFPCDYDTWLSWGHTIPNGTPPRPIFPWAAFDTLLLLDSVVNPDNQLAEWLRLDGDPVQFLWVVPITPAEREYQRAHGTEGLLDVFQAVQHPPVFDERRSSYL